MNTKLNLIIAMAAAMMLAGAGSARANAAGKITGKVDAKKKYRKNTVVYVKSVPGKHAAPAKPVHLDQRGQKFKPFVLPVVQGSTVEFLNNDNTGHNVFSPDGEKYDLGVFSKGQRATHTFAKPGVYTQLCKMHPSMLAYIVVLQNPYFAVTAKDGSFTIDHVPPGNYELAVWNERKKAKPVAVSVTAGQTTEAAIKLGK